MAVVQLASAADVSTALGRALTAAELIKVEAILDKASELFRRASGQQFTLDESTVRLKVNGGLVRLPQRPLVSVDAVTDDDGYTLDYELLGSVLTTELASDRFVRVTYTHGGEVPDLVRLCVADVARRVLELAPAAVQGKTQATRTAGPYTESATYATWAVGGQTMLSPDDERLAKSFRPVRGSVIVQTS